MLKVFLVLVLAFAVSVLVFYISEKPILLKPESDSFNLNLKKAEEVKLPKLTLEKIFYKDKESNSLDPNKLITLIATGDVIPARSVNFQVMQRKDFNWPYLKTADILKSADITFINLETPLINGCPITQEGMFFCGDSRNIEGLDYAGVDIVSLANNHSANYGRRGIDETKKVLEEEGILVTGLNGAVYKEIKGIKFAFLGYSDIEKTSLVSTAEEEKIKNEVDGASKNADIVIVQFHWGREYVTPPDDRQKFLGRLAIDWGAALVIGNHPHWIKPVEIYKDKLITYGHGNFIFDQEWSQKTKEGVVGKYTFYGKNLIDAQFLPVEIKDYGQPYFLERDKDREILDEMYNESLKLQM